FVSSLPTLRAAPPTPLFPRSLHDALPICPSSARVMRCSLRSSALSPALHWAPIWPCRPPCWPSMLPSTAVLGNMLGQQGGRHGQIGAQCNAGDKADDRKEQRITRAEEGQIGRASCRERGKSGVGGAARKVGREDT